MKLLLLAFIAFEIVLSKDIALKQNYRIASGTAGKRGENLDFCYISAKVDGLEETCGCLIASPLYVVTSAQCLTE